MPLPAASTSHRLAPYLRECCQNIFLRRRTNLELDRRAGIHRDLLTRAQVQRRALRRLPDGESPEVRDREVAGLADLLLDRGYDVIGQRTRCRGWHLR